VTARYLDPAGQVEKVRGSFHEYPAEDWIVLSKAEGEAFRIGGDLDPALARRVLATFHPLDMSVGETPDARNRFEEATLRVTFISRTMARLEGRLRMARSFTQIENPQDRPIRASLRGYLELDPEDRRILSLRMITEDATFGSERFGIALRSVP
jgi:hypothetical protein